MPPDFSRTLRSLETDGPTQGVVLTAAALAVVWAVWFVVAPVPVYEVTESARIEVNAAAHPIAPQVDGRIMVTNLALGRDATAGEVLVVLDSEEEQLALREYAARRQGLVRKRESLRAQIAAERDAARRYAKARAVALGEYRAKVEESEARARFAESQFEALVRLRSRGASSSEEYQRGQREAEAARAAVKTNRLAAERVDQERDVEEDDRRARIAGLEVAAAELEGILATEDAAARRLEHAVELRKVRAPVAGRVGEVAAAFRKGAFVRAGERLGAIVPSGEPRAVALFPASAVGRIRPTQPGRLRLLGYPWTQFGTVRARVTGVGNEAREGLIRVELRLLPSPRSTIPLVHGLPGTAEVEIERVTPVVLALRAAGQFLTARHTTTRPAPAAAPEVGP
jgi:membrane fusion protein (multidrug efflux system)